MNRCFVTGASGFLGSYVTRCLLQRGHAVAVLLRPDSTPGRIEDLLPSLTVVRGSMDAISALRPAMDAFKPDTVVHFAWRGVAGAARNDPEQAANIADTVRLAALAADTGSTCFVGTGSQAEYGLADAPIAETTPTRPTSLYGAAKLASGQMVEGYCALRGLRFAWLRVFSTYGPLDNDHWLIPGLIKSLLNREKPSLTACEQIWDFLHAADAARAVAAVVEQSSLSGYFNLGSGEPVSLREVVLSVRDAIDPALPLGIGELPYRPDQVMKLLADVTRLRTEAGWTPEIPLARGIRQTVDWYRTTARP